MNRRDRERGETEVVIFGRHPVHEALRSQGARVLEVKVARSVSARDRHALRGRVHECEAEIPFEEISRDAMDRYSAAPRHDQGYAARVRLLGVTEVDAFVDANKGRAARRPLRLLALDGVTNSQNVGMVVRSVVGAGLDGLLWPVHGQPWVNGLVVRAAAGAIFECPIVRCDSLTLGLVALQSAGFSSFGLDAGAKRSLFEVDPGHRAIFVLGSESVGLSEEIRAMLDEPVSIPMPGPLESLNVAVAAGLVSFHAAGLLAPRS